MNNQDPISQEKLQTIINQGAIIIDVRPQNQFESSHIQGAINIPLDNMENEIDTLRAYKKPIITYSTNGHSSQVAFSKIKNESIEVYDAGAISNIAKLITVRGDHESVGQRNLGDFFR